MTATFCVRAVTLLALLAIAGLTQETPGGKGPAFEVASVKPSVPGPGGRGAKGGPGFNDPTLFSVRNRPLKPLILMAYAVADYQLSGGPAWIESERWDVDARPAGPATREQMMAMLQALLADRFQLRVHNETKPVATYLMQVAKGGPKFGTQFHRLEEGARPADGRNYDPKQGLPMGGTLEHFAFLLRDNMRMTHPDDAPMPQAEEVPPILDKTGLTGEYEIFLRISHPKDDLRALVEEQLGLKLELRKEPAKMLVVDRVMKPSGN